MVGNLGARMIFNLNKKWINGLSRISEFMDYNCIGHIFLLIDDHDEQLEVLKEWKALRPLLQTRSVGLAHKISLHISMVLGLYCLWWFINKAAVWSLAPWRLISQDYCFVTQTLLLTEMYIGEKREMIPTWTDVSGCAETKGAPFAHTPTSEFRSFYLVMCPLLPWLPGASSSSKFAIGLNAKCRDKKSGLEEAFWGHPAYLPASRQIST